MELSESRLCEILERLPSARIAVFGDFYLDRYGLGTMEAISREAPVPIVRLKRRASNRYSPGGAGNTAMNLAGLGAQLWAVGVIGADLYGGELKKQLAAKGADVSGLIEDGSRVTGAFEKFYAAAYHSLSQQVARVDTENENPPAAEVERRLTDKLRELLDQLDGMIVADYAEVEGTGVVTPALLQIVSERAAERDRVIVGDSRDRIGEFRHILGVPNDYEAAMAAGVYRSHTAQDVPDEVVRQSGEILTKKLQREVIITRGYRGMTLFDNDGRPTHVATRPAEGQIDPTGAGDTVGAAVAASLVSGASLHEAAEIANLAAGVTVVKIGTTGTATPDEILTAFRQTNALAETAG